MAAKLRHSCTSADVAKIIRERSGSEMQLLAHLGNLLLHSSMCSDCQAPFLTCTFGELA